MPETYLQEIEDIYHEELSYIKESFCFIVRNNNGNIIGSIRVFKWDKQTPTPMHKIFHIFPLNRIVNSSDSSFWHIGRFAINSYVGFSTMTLFKQLMTLAVTPIIKEKNSYMLAETDCHLLRVMNALGIKTERIGESLTYLASETIPVYSSKDGLTDFYKRFYPLLTAS